MIIYRNIGLRSITKKDLIQIMDWRNNPHLRSYFREYRELNLENQDEWFNTKILGGKNDVMFGIIDMHKKELIGVGGLCYIDWLNRNAELSIYIGKNYVYIDEFFAPNAVRALLNYGFRDINLHRIYMEVFENDKKKRRVLDNLGIRLEGEHIEKYWKEGKWQNSYTFGITQTEWIGRKKSE